MKVVNSVDDIKEPFVVTVGNFDGLHIGHRRLLSCVVSKAKYHHAKSCLITFCPHPIEIFEPSVNNFFINSSMEKKKIIQGLGIDYFLPLKFTFDFSEKSPGDFIKENIDSNFLRSVHLGYNFFFGKDKKGNFKFVQDYFSQRDVEVSIQHRIETSGQDISSTVIRSLIRSGNFESVRSMLGRLFFVSGIVARGVRRGRSIGFPTANIEWDKKRVYPDNGVYITRTTMENRRYNSVTNIGVKPTFQGSLKKSIETNIFDFNKEIYDQVIQVEFFKKIREEKKFSSVESLIDQIGQDIEVSNFFLKNI